MDVNTTKPSALIVGGGIIGLASAFRLARSGHAVTLFDPSVARGATWAAAGMVAPSAEIAENNGYEPGRDNFFIRTVSWQANHDAFESGWNESLLRRLVGWLAARGKVSTSRSPAPGSSERRA